VIVRILATSSLERVKRASEGAKRTQRGIDMNHRAMALLTIILLAASLALCGGCKGSKSAPQKLAHQPEPPARVPKKKDVALNKSLRDSARREIEQAMKSHDAGIRANAVEAAQRGMGADAKDIVLAGLNDSEANVRFA